MARNDRNEQDAGGGSRDKYRDNDDARGVVGPGGRDDVGSDSRAEARGDARENVGNTARGTAADPSHGGNDRQESAERPRDEYDDDLERDNRRGREGQGMSDLAREVRSGMSAIPADQDDERHGWRQHARQGQAESPVQTNHFEPPKDKEGHH